MKRLFYDELLEWKNNHINTPLMIVGARQIGKTYLVKEFITNEFNDYIYINLLDSISVTNIFEKEIDFKDKVEEFEAYIGKKITKYTVIVFDEVQESESLISHMKSFCESDFPYKIICLGSLLGVKFKRFNKSFPVGKVIIKRMYPLNFKEFLMATNNDLLISHIEKAYDKNESLSNSLHNKALKLYKTYLLTGGMPENILNYINSDMNIYNVDGVYLKSLYETYLSDMTKFVSNICEKSRIEKVYNSIPSQLSKENKKFQYSYIDNNARKRDYELPLDWLLSSGLVLGVNYVSDIRKPLEASKSNDIFKLYLSDTGLLINMLNIDYKGIMLDEDSTITSNTMRIMGAITENYVVNELISNNLNLYYWYELQKCEIDIMIDTKDGIIPIEIKAGTNKKSTSLNYFRDKFKNNISNVSYRISQNNFGLENGIKSIPLYAVFCIK